MAGTWSATGTIKKFFDNLPSDLPNNPIWIWQMELDSSQQAYIIVYQRPDYDTPIKGPQTAMELENKISIWTENTTLRHLLWLITSCFQARPLLAESLSTCREPDWTLLAKFEQDVSGSSNIYLFLSSTNNVHVYYLKKTGTTADNGRGEYEWAKLATRNSGGESNRLNKK